MMAEMSRRTRTAVAHRGTLRLSGGVISRLQQQRGISTLEIMVSLSFMVILLAAAAPSLPPIFGQYALLGASGEVYSVLQRARITAIRANRRCSFSVLSSTTYQIYVDSNGNGVLDTGEPVTT